MGSAKNNTGNIFTRILRKGACYMLPQTSKLTPVRRPVAAQISPVAGRVHEPPTCPPVHFVGKIHILVSFGLVIYIVA